jgi:hypothetical protein
MFNEGVSVAHLAPEKITEILIRKRPTYQVFINYNTALSDTFLE